MTIEPIWLPETQQQVFRRLLNAMARPAKLWDLSDLIGAEVPWKAVLCTLVDASVNLSDPHGILDDSCREFTRSAACEPEKAAFIIAQGDCRPGFEPFPGTLESPERGATILITVSRLGDAGNRLTCSGPGIENGHDLAVEGLHPKWLQKRSVWNDGFPLGVDFLLVDDRRITALPRTTRVLEREG